jgi:HEAT repeat protein
MLKKIFVGAAIFASTVIFCLLLLELTLKTGFFDRVDSPSPVWIPNKFVKIDNAINRKNYEYAHLNPYGFTDTNRDIKKKNGIKRIAVLGDSFIWGYGLPYEQIWSHKLEKMILDKYKNIELMSWGLSAWSTLDEMSFLEKHGIKYDIDMLIVGFVTNDPDIGDVKMKPYKWQGNILIKTLKILFPDAISFIASYTNRFLTEHFYADHQYDNWEKALYTDENLLNYLEILQDFSRFCNSKNIDLLFVLTAPESNDIIIEKFNKIIPLLEQAHIKYLNLLPSLQKHLGHIPTRKLWANPANGHPGDFSTSVIAKEVYNYLETKGTFSPYNIQNIKITKENTSGKISSQIAITDLINTILNDKDWDIKKKAAIALAEMENPKAVDMLINALNNKNPDIREAAVSALGEMTEPGTVVPLINMLRDEDFHVRIRAVLELEKKDDPRIVEAFIRTVKKDKNQYVRRRALLALSKIKDPRVVESLIACLKDNFYFNRKTAVIALGKTHDQSAVDSLIALLNDDVRDIRTEIVEALGEIGDLRAVTALKITALNDNDPYVRDLAADAIKKMTGKDFAKYRRKLLRMWQKYFW